MKRLLKKRIKLEQELNEIRLTVEPFLDKGRAIEQELRKVIKAIENKEIFK